MLVTDNGQLIRFAVDEVRIAGRRTQGYAVPHRGKRTRRICRTSQ